MITTSAPQMRWVSLFGLVMLLLSITPGGVSAQTGLVPAGDVAQTDGPAIEVLLVECPPGTTGDPLNPDSACDTGLVGVGIQVTSVDALLGIDLPKSTVASYTDGTGPGVINTGILPNDEYRIQIDLPEEGNNFSFACHQRTSKADVLISPAAGDVGNAFQVRNDGTEDIVCNAFVAPTTANPVMEITYRECVRADFPSETREATDLQDNCNDIATTPPTLNVRDLNTAGEPVSQHRFDAQGKVELSLNPANYQMFTDLGMDNWGEYLFCEYPGQPLYEKEFDPARGIVEFTNLMRGEEFECSWYGVSAAGEPSADAGKQQSESAQVPEAPVVSSDATNLTNTASVEVHLGICPVDYDGNDRINDCHPNGADDIPFTLTSSNGFDRTLNTMIEGDSGPGIVRFIDLPAGDYVLAGGPPQDFGSVSFYCSDVESIGQFEDYVGTFTLADGQNITCDWYFTPDNQQAAPPVEEVNANFTVAMLGCPINDGSWDPSSLDGLQANCDSPVSNTVIHMENQGGGALATATDSAGVIALTDLPPGTWNIYSDVPLEAATEYLYCVYAEGVSGNVQLNEYGVATVEVLNGDDINCVLYVAPENLRGEITGSSIEIHLSACPIGYEGDAWYADCHDNGVADMEFTLTGPSLVKTSKTIVERTPGPGIVRFTELPAGDYTLAGGPPQDFGSVFLYCSDPATNTPVDVDFKNSVGNFSLTEEQSIICDWYFVPDDQGVITPTPVPERAEIFTTMFICPPEVNVAGVGFSQLDSKCDKLLNDVPITLQAPGGVPITANTGASGDGAIRFYDLRSGDYVLTPELPTDYVNAAVYCDLDGGDVYQKALSNGSTTFVNVEGELISCSWFVTAKPQPAPGLTGSITIREMLCEGDRANIVDWERECQPGSSGVNFTITSSTGTLNQTLTPNAEGVAVFSGLPNEYYEVKQSQGAWCRAKAERVDSQSRVIVAGGGNTDVFLYQCNQEIGMPNTGSGPISQEASLQVSLMLGAAALPLFAIAAWQIRRWSIANATPQHVGPHDSLTRTQDGYRHR